LLYALYVWRVGTWFKSAAVSGLCRAALLLTPFVLEFFSLFRGYGAGIAFVLMGMYHLVRFTTVRSMAHSLWAVLAFSLAGFASLNTLLLWMQAFGLLD